jgi:hypothetical protein
MNAPLVRALLRLYPRPWRQRYGDELAALLQEQPTRLRIVLDVVRAALGQRVSSLAHAGMAMSDSSGTALHFARVPSAVIPIALSFAALTVLVVSLAMSNWTVVRESDEGAAAHLYQLCMTLQAPVLLFFALKWIRRSPKRALAVLAIQLAAALLAMAPVYLLGL